MERIGVEAGQPYEVLIGRDLLKGCGTRILELFQDRERNPDREGGCPYRKVAVISDNLVGAIYGTKVLSGLREAGFEAELITFPNGEASKNIHVLEKLYEELIHLGLSRKDLIVALGGGVTGDMAGFAAATYLRGVDYIQIPTTLIAQTDSSVGGKTAIDTPFGKNLIGAFYQPKLVLCDVDTLSTLPQMIFNEGMGEVIKYALLSDRPLEYQGREVTLAALLELPQTEETLERIVAECVRIKADIVKRDEFEKGDRMLLNLGHTIGHAVERASEYTIRHGAGVAIGMWAIVSACVRNGLLDPKVQELLGRLLDCYELPREYADCSMDWLVELASTDKKRDSSGINVILCGGIGGCYVRHMTMDALKDMLRS